jgi:3-oxoacyl-[acyl-carrier protein] reductase
MRNIVVSGDDTVIGLAVARRFAEASDRVLIVGRRRNVLTAATDALNSEDANGLVSSLVADLTVMDEVQPLAEESAAVRTGRRSRRRLTAN